MKLAVLKLTSLLVLLIGILPIVLMFTEVPYVERAGTILSNFSGVDTSEEISVSDKIITMIVAVVLIVIGFYGFIPAFGRNKSARQLIIKGEQGDIKLNMDSVQVNLARQLTDMKEVHKAKLTIEPLKGGKSATLHAVVEIEKIPGVSTREIANSITANLTRNAKEVLGLEDMLKVKLDVEGIHLDEKSTKMAETSPTDSRVDSNKTNLVQDKVDAVSITPATVAPIVAAETEVAGSSFDTADKDKLYSMSFQDDAPVSESPRVDEVRISNESMDEKKESDDKSSADFKQDENDTDSFGWRDTSSNMQDSEESKSKEDDTGFSFLDEEETKDDADENKPREY